MTRTFLLQLTEKFHYPNLVRFIASSFVMWFHYYQVHLCLLQMIGITQLRRDRYYRTGYQRSHPDPEVGADSNAASYAEESLLIGLMISDMVTVCVSTEIPFVAPLASSHFSSGIHSALFQESLCFVAL